MGSLFLVGGEIIDSGADFFIVDLLAAMEQSADTKIGILDAATSMSTPQGRT